jgi:hypothetical protein
MAGAALVVGLVLAGVAVAPPASATVCPPAAAAPFTDVPIDHPFCREIATVEEKGVTTGYPDGTFRPGDPITRQAVAAMLWRAANADHPGLEPAPCVAPPFPDVPISHPFCGHIRDAALLNIFNGYDDGTFRPGTNISRQAVAAVLTRFPDGPIPLLVCGAAPFTDVPADHAFCNEISFLASVGVVNGYGDGTFRPGIDISRQAFAAMLVRWINELDGP